MIRSDHVHPNVPDQWPNFASYVEMFFDFAIILTMEISSKFFISNQISASRMIMFRSIKKVLSTMGRNKGTFEIINLTYVKFSNYLFFLRLEAS